MRRTLAILSFKSSSKKPLITTNSGTTSNEPSHISRLPLELLALIFDTGIDPEYINLERLHRTPKYPLIISSVCRLWRHVALNIAHSIWSAISIHPDRTLELPSLYLNRSGESLLHFCIGENLGPRTKKEEKDKPSAGYLNCLNFILKYSHRWKYVILIGYNFHFPDILAAFPSVRAPNLTNFHLYGSAYDNLFKLPIFMNEGAPVLVHLKLTGISRFGSQFSPFLSVQTLHLLHCGHYMDNTTFCSFFKSFPSLRRLILRAFGPGTMTTHRTVTLPNLVELESAQRSGFGSRRMLIPNVQMPLLRVVTLSVVEEPGCEFFWPSFESYQHFPGHILPSVEILTVPGTFMRALQMVPCVFPNVRNLVVSETLAAEKLPYVALKDFGFDHARDWPSLERLTVHGWNDASDAGYLINFIKGLLEWHGRRTIEKVQLEILYGDTFQDTELEDAFDKLEVQLELIYAYQPKCKIDYGPLPTFFQW